VAAAHDVAHLRVGSGAPHQPVPSSHHQVLPQHLQPVLNSHHQVLPEHLRPVLSGHPRMVETALLADAEP